MAIEAGSSGGGGNSGGSGSKEGSVPASSAILHRRTSGSGGSSSSHSSGGGATVAVGGEGGAGRPVVNKADGASGAEGPAAAGAAATAAVAGGRGKAVQCRSCVGVALLTSRMLREGRPAACYGVRRGLATTLPPHASHALPEVRDEYIEEVLRSDGRQWTYMCVGASETLVEDAPADGSAGNGGKGVGGLPPLPACRGLLVFMDGDTEAAVAAEGSRARRRRGGSSSSGVGAGEEAERPVHDAACPTQQPPSQPLPQRPLPPPPSSASASASFPGVGGEGWPVVGETARRVGAFWANASEDFGSKYLRYVSGGSTCVTRTCTHACMVGLWLAQHRRWCGKECAACGGGKRKGKMTASPALR